MCIRDRSYYCKFIATSILCPCRRDLTLVGCSCNPGATHQNAVLPQQKFYIYTLYLYLLFQTIVSLLYISKGNSIPSCKTLAYSRFIPFASTKDLIAPAIFLQFTTFILHSASSVPFSSIIYPKYLNSDICSSCSPSNLSLIH